MNELTLFMVVLLHADPRQLQGLIVQAAQVAFIEAADEKAAAAEAHRCGYHAVAVLPAQMFTKEEA